MQKVKVETLTKYVGYDEPSAREIRSYNELVNEMKAKRDEMNKKYGANNWNSMTDIEYRELKALSDEKDAFESKYPNYDFSNKNKTEQRKESVKEMTNQEFRNLLKSGKELSDLEMRADSHHVMQVLDGGADYSAQRVETLQQAILKKMGEQQVLMQFIPFVEQRGTVKIPCSTNTKKAVKVSEGEEFPKAHYDLTYLNVDLVKYAQQAILTNELLEDSQLAVQQHVMTEIANDFGRALAQDFLTGNVEGKCEGIAVSEKARVHQATGLTVDEVKKAFFKLPAEVRHAKDLICIMATDTMVALDALKDNNGRSLLNPANDAQAQRYFNTLYGAKVVEVEQEQLPEGVHMVFVSPSKAVHAGMARNFNIHADANKRSEFDETVVLASVRCSMVVKDGDAIVVVKA